MNMLSAINSYLIKNFGLLVRMERNENRLDIINNIAATPVSSSMMDTSLYLEIFNDVNTTKQNPNKLDEVFKICEVLLDDIYRLGIFKIEFIFLHAYRIAILHSIPFHLFQHLNNLIQLFYFDRV